MYKLEVTKKNDSTFKLFAFPTSDKIMISPISRPIQAGENIQEFQLIEVPADIMLKFYKDLDIYFGNKRETEEQIENRLGKEFEHDIREQEVKHAREMGRMEGMIEILKGREIPNFVKPASDVKYTECRN